LGRFKEIILDTFQLVKKVYFNCDSNTLLPSPPSPKKQEQHGQVCQDNTKARQTRAEVKERPGSHKMSEETFLAKINYN